MANWFCSVFNVVCVINVSPIHAVDQNLLTLLDKVHKNIFKRFYEIDHICITE